MSNPVVSLQTILNQNGTQYIVAVLADGTLYQSKHIQPYPKPRHSPDQGESKWGAWQRVNSPIEQIL
jgi:hypothetical protein